MNINSVTPEQVGISSEQIRQYVECLEKAQLSTHNLLLARGDQIIYEQYWEPFGPDFLHRQYSVSKSIVALAVGFAEQDGLLSLDDPMSRFFADELADQPDRNLQNQTVRHMLMMATAKPGRGWFNAQPEDLVRFYFANNRSESRPGGTIFQYDSTGAFVLGALVERLTGMRLMDYLRIKLFDKIGVSPEATCLTCPGGHAWGDSAVLCTARDLYKIARFVMNKGRWNGEQILNEAFVTAATSKQIDNNHGLTTGYNIFGYGYLIWMTYDGGFSFNGMGCQFAICVPDKDLILIYNGDNQGNEPAKRLIFDRFFELIVRSASDQPLPENPAAVAALGAPRTLMTAQGATASDFQAKIDGRTFVFAPNPMGITRLTLRFDDEVCRLDYTNAQGDKTLLFGMGKNVFDRFPEEGYSDQVGSQRTTGHYYRCAVSGVWSEPQKLQLKVQIIDTYFGRLDIVLGFRDEHRVGLYMQKVAEDFLDTYQGFADGRAE